MSAPNVFRVGDLTFEALTDRLVVLEDEFKSGLECDTCGGSGTATCTNCFGEKEIKGKKCSWCEGRGNNPCTACGGKGGILVIPETTQRRPTSGQIVSTGPGKTEAGVLVPMQLKVGESVLYSNFAGYVVDLTPATGKPITLRILHESEILCKLTGHLTLTNLKGKSDVALASN